MNVFEMEGFLRGKCLPGDMKVNETTAEYLVRKLRQAGELIAAHSTIEKAREVTNCPQGVDLQDHLKALVAENAALLSFISHSCYSYDGDGSDVCDSYVDAESSPWFPKTTATDSILRAAEARGVEKFAAVQRGVAERLQNCCGDVADHSIKFCLESAEEAEDFAMQLRKGKAE